MSLIIETAGKEHAALLAEMGATTFCQAFAAQNKAEDMDLYLRSQFTAEKLLAEFDQPGATFYIAYLDDEPIGYIKTGTKVPAALRGHKCMELERLYLLETQHGKGIGRQMLHHCIARAQEDGCDILWLGVWEYNPKAISLYRKAGFEKFGEHIFQLGTDPQTDSMMKLQLH